MSHKYALLLALLALFATYPVFAAGKSADKMQFHSPQTEAEKALDKALWLEGVEDTKRLQDVTAWLKGQGYPHSFRYGDYFTQHYLKKWRDTQINMLAACKKNTDDQSLCEPFSLTCNNFSNHSISYGYRTLESDENKAIISFLPQGWEGNGDVFHVVKEATFWKVDDTDCAHNIWHTKK